MINQRQQTNEHGSPVVHKRNTRRKRKWPAIIGTVALAIAVTAAAIWSGILTPRPVQADALNYQIVSLTTGTLSQDVTGTGTIAMNGTSTVTIPAGLTVKTVNMEAGESVAPGDSLVTLDKASIQTKIKSLDEELATINTELGSLSGDTMSGSITATVKGRVKVIYGRVGDNVQTVMKNNGALMILSVDGYMKVSLIPQRSVTLNEDVNVILPSGSTLDGSVYSIDDSGTATILVSDATLAAGELVTIQNESGELIGTGSAQINNALRVTGTGGTINTAPRSINASVAKGNTLFTLTNLPISTEYAQKLQDREDCLADIANMQALLENPDITTGVTGTVKTIDIANGQTLEEDTAITLTTRDSITLSASIDELDILKVQPGMTAKVSVDAITGEGFSGTITKISAQGTTSGNVTTYPVKIELNNDLRFMPGMSATATIAVSESRNALLVPVAALNTSKGETFVYIANSGLTNVSSTDDPGVRTVITTGLSNDEYAEVLSGLSPTDQIVIVRNSTSSTQQTSQQSGMMTMDAGAMMGGGTPPSGSGRSR